jgi:hypothetical protein
MRSCKIDEGRARLCRPLLLSPSDDIAICVEKPGGGVARARLISVPKEEESDPGRWTSSPVVVKRGK